MGKALTKILNSQKKQGFFSHFSQIVAYSWRSLFSHPWILLLLFIFNIGFIFLFSFYQQPLGMKITYTINLLSNLFQTIVQAVDVPGFVGAAKNTSLISVLFNDLLIQKITSDLLLLFALLAVVAYSVYTFFQSTSVNIIGWMVLDKKPYSIWSFIKINLFWYCIYLILRLLILIADLVYSLITNGKGMFESLDFLYVFVHVVLFYFVFISYSFTGKLNVWQTVKQTIRAGSRLKFMRYYLINFIPILLYLVPFTKNVIVAPILNVLTTLGVVGIGLQLAVLFFVYVLFVANIFTITYEVVLTGENK